MDRFCWEDGEMQKNESIVLSQKNIRLYDGDQKTAFDKGLAALTNHKIIWTDHNDQNVKISLPLHYITSIDRISSGFTRSAKLVLHLSSKQPNHKPSPVSHSVYNFVYLSFSSGGESEFLKVLNEMLQEKAWTSKVTSPISHRGVGILGIERNREENKFKTDSTIQIAFEDLNNLMRKAKEMVSISRSISQKLKDQQDEVTQDEALKFKSYLMNLGIEDPITRDSHGSGEQYFVQLAHQIASFITPVLQENDGMLTLADVYCRVNRARGMELLSPEDLERSCSILSSLNLNMKLKIYSNGVKVLQLTSCDEAAMALQVLQMVEEKESLSSDELASLSKCSVLLAKQRLLVAEEMGKLCRDESNEGLRFFPNLFLTRA